MLQQRDEALSTVLPSLQGSPPVPCPPHVTPATHGWGVFSPLTGYKYWHLCEIVHLSQILKEMLTEEAHSPTSLAASPEPS